MKKVLEIVFIVMLSVGLFMCCTAGGDSEYLITYAVIGLSLFVSGFIGLGFCKEPATMMKYPVTILLMVITFITEITFKLAYKLMFIHHYKLYKGSYKNVYNGILSAYDTCYGTSYDEEDDVDDENNLKQSFADPNLIPELYNYITYQNDSSKEVN